MSSISQFALEGERLVPRLIELQAFPSVFGFQLLLLGCIRKAYPAIPRNWTSSFGGIKDEAYLDLLRRHDHRRFGSRECDPAGHRTGKTKDPGRFRGYGNIAWHPLRLRNENQESVGAQLFYDRDGREVRIERIYNRVIFDELMSPARSESTVSVSG